MHMRIKESRVKILPLFTASAEASGCARFCVVIFPLKAIKSAPVDRSGVCALRVTTNTASDRANAFRRGHGYTFIFINEV